MALKLLQKTPKAHYLKHYSCEFGSQTHVDGTLKRVELDEESEQAVITFWDPAAQPEDQIGQILPFCSFKIDHPLWCNSSDSFPGKDFILISSSDQVQFFTYENEKLFLNTVDQEKIVCRYPQYEDTQELEVSIRE